MVRRSILLAAVLLASATPGAAREDRNTKVLKDRKDVEATGLWIYNDLPRAVSVARKEGKPLLVVFR